MGGSGGGLPGIGGEFKGGTDGPDELNCPRKFEAELIDTFQTGNSEYALSLTPGTELAVERARQGGVVILHQDKIIGYLRPEFDSIADCISSGWKYSASITGVRGDINSPIIRVLVLGVPR